MWQPRFQQKFIIPTTLHGCTCTIEMLRYVFIGSGCERWGGGAHEVLTIILWPLEAKCRVPCAGLWAKEVGGASSAPSFLHIATPVSLVEDSSIARCICGLC